jgi:hypothetical protein
MRSARSVASFFADRKEPTMDRRREGDTGGVDEVARQRQKRSAARRDQLVGGATTVTVGQLADQAAAATTATDADAVSRYLEGGGHSPATIEDVIRCLGLDRTAEPAQDETVEALAHPSRGQQRLRTVAQLEALLLKD